MSKNILVLNRWSDELADFSDVIDHKNNIVSYIVTEEGEKGVKVPREFIADFQILPSMDDKSRILSLVESINTRFGCIDHVIALSEFDLEMAATIRTKYSIPGCDEQTVPLFRNKVEMKKCMNEKGIRIPQFTSFNNTEDVKKFVEQVGFPIVLKPKKGAASQGIKIVNSWTQTLNFLSQINFNEYECEEYIEGLIYHVDGLIKDNKLLFAKASKYINTCLDFNKGIPLGSVMVDDVKTEKELLDFTSTVVKSFSLKNSAFHLEIIYSKDGPVFLEIGARVGGGEIPFLIKDLYGIDLIKEWIRLEIGTFKDTSLNISDKSIQGGFLLIPEPDEVPCRVQFVTSLIDSSNYIYKEIIPNCGDILDGHGGYEKISGRFLFRGEKSSQIEEAIYKAIDTFQIKVDSHKYVKL